MKIITNLNRIVQQATLVNFEFLSLMPLHLNEENEKNTVMLLQIARSHFQSQ
jgi:hypothetical protein